MANIDFSQLSKQTTNQGSYTTNNYPRVGFFSLKDPGDEAVVRIMHDTTASFDIKSIHNVPLPGYQYGRSVNCLRGMDEPVDKCPLCASGEHNSTNKIFIHMVQYVRDESGNIVQEAKVWERPCYKWGNKLAAYINDYGPLSDVLVKIRRIGTGKNTDYEIIPIPSTNQAFNSPVYAKPTTDMFENYNVVGTIVMDKDYNDMMSYLDYGSFPVKEQTERTYVAPTQQTISTASEDVPFTMADTPFANNTVYDAQPVQQQAQPQYKAPTQAQPQANVAPWMNVAPTQQQTQVQRPTRTY